MEHSPQLANHLEISHGALLRNLEFLRSQNPAQVAATVKADAYGLGAVKIANLLQSVGVSHFCVVLPKEGAALRQSGVRGTILVLGGAVWTFDIATVFEHQLTVVLSSQEELIWLENAAKTRKQKIEAHLKIETGMARLGVRYRDDGAALEAFCKSASKCEFVSISGVMTHHANSDLNDAQCELQNARYKRAKALVQKHLSPFVSHAANSAAALLQNLDEDWIRPGISLYGISPFNALYREKLEPVVTWKAPIVARQSLRKGEPLSYGGTYICERDTEIAVVRAGYADGYDRRLSNNADMLLQGQRCAVRGRVCMDMTLIDVTDVVDAFGQEAAALRRPVILMGKDGKNAVDAYELAQRTDTIPYEVLCRINARVPRNHVE